MPHKTLQQDNILPMTFKGRMLVEDLTGAICGSPTQCAIANMIRRTLDPPPSFVSVKMNRVTITWKNMIHHYELTNAALRLVAQNDDGSLSFMPGESRIIKLPRIRVLRANTDLSDKRKGQIEASRQRRKEAGKKSPRNSRFLVSREQGIAMQKLQRRTAAKAQAQAEAY